MPDAGPLAAQIIQMLQQSGQQSQAKKQGTPNVTPPAAQPWSIATDPELNQAPPGSYALIPPGTTTPGAHKGQPIADQEYSYQGKAYDYTGKQQKGGINPTPPPDPSTLTAPQNPDDVLTAGLGMFFSQYLAPLVSQMSSQNNNLINMWGQQMNSALNQQLPPGVAATMKPYMLQNEQIMATENQQSMAAFANQGNFNTLMNQLGSSAQAQQALAQALPTAAAQGLLASGNTQGLAQLFANMGINTSPYGVAANTLLNNPSLQQTLLQGGNSKSPSPSPTATTNATPQTVIVQPQSGTPGANMGTNASAQSAAQQSLVQQAALQLLANQTQQQNSSAGAANALAGAGYNPYVNPTG